jgi:hypothetical protein
VVNENNSATGLTAAGAPPGFHGVDPVSFLDIQTRLDGTATYTVVHESVAYYFSSKTNADRTNCKAEQNWKEIQHTAASKL